MFCGRRLHAVLVTRYVSCNMSHWWWCCGQEGAAFGQIFATTPPVRFWTSLQLETMGAERPVGAVGVCINPSMVVMCEQNKVFGLYVWLGYRMILVLFVCVGYISSLVIVVSVLRSLTGDDGLLGPLGSINGYSSTGMNKELG